MMLLASKNQRKPPRSKKKWCGGCGGSKSNENDLLELNKAHCKCKIVLLNKKLYKFEHN